MAGNRTPARSVAYGAGADVIASLAMAMTRPNAVVRSATGGVVCRSGASGRAPGAVRANVGTPAGAAPDRR